MTERRVKIYEVLYVDPDGPAGPAGDGSHVKRFDNKSDADTFAEGRVLWNGTPTSPIELTVPIHVARRWGFA